MQHPPLQTLLHLLRVPRFAFREFHSPGPIRRTLIADGRWGRVRDGKEILTLGPGGKIFMQLRDGLLGCWENALPDSCTVPLRRLNEHAQALLALANPGVAGPRSGEAKAGCGDWYIEDDNWRFFLKSSSLDILDVLRPTHEAQGQFLANLYCNHTGGWTYLDACSTTPEAVVREFGKAEHCLELRRALTNFQSGLDSAAVQVCRDLEVRSEPFYNYLAACPREVAEYRRQAVRVFPILARYLAESTDAPAVQIRIAIDCRMPLIVAIARAFGITRDVVKRIAGRTTDELGFDVGLVYCESGHPHWPGQAPEAMAPDEFLRSLKYIPPENHPTTREDWRELHVLNKLLNWNYMEKDLRAKVIQFFAVRGWTRASKELAGKHGSLAIIRDCGEFLEALSDTLSEQVKPELDLPRSMRLASISAAYKFASRQGVRRLLDLVARWRAQYTFAWGQYAATHTSATASAGFPVKELVQTGDYVITPLLSYPDLVSEGAAMGHCVGTCYRQMISGESCFFSLKNKAGERLSTFDLGFSIGTDGKLAICVNQHKGPSNAIPPAFCQQAVDDFVSRLLKEHAAELLAFVATRQVPDGVKESEDEDTELDLQSQFRLHAVRQVVSGDLARLVRMAREEQEQEE